jgi:hypothetical protein
MLIFIVFRTFFLFFLSSSSNWSTPCAVVVVHSCVDRTNFLGLLSPHVNNLHWVERCYEYGPEQIIILNNFYAKNCNSYYFYKCFHLLLILVYSTFLCCLSSLPYGYSVSTLIKILLLLLLLLLPMRRVFTTMHPDNMLLRYITFQLFEVTVYSTCNDTCHEERFVQLL